MLVTRARTLVRFAHYYGKRWQSSLPPLPAQEDWKKIFHSQGPQLRDRVYVRNPVTAAELADAFVPEGERDRVIVEAFPGPGALTRALLELPKERIRKIIILEDQELFHGHLQALEEADPRVKVVPHSGYSWDSYNVMEGLGVLDDVPRQEWSKGVHPQLQFVAHLPHNIKGEQLVSQLLRCIPDESWLFRYGRVPLSFILGDWLHSRLSAEPKDKAARCKVSVIAQAVSDITHALPAGRLQPYAEHFHPIPSLAVQAKMQEHRAETRRAGSPHVALNIVPRANPLIAPHMLDQWDYVLRRLFVKKSTPLARAVPFLAPGAEILLKSITDPSRPLEQRVDIKRSPRDMTNEDWALLLQAFDEWPFAPEDLLITDGMTRSD